MSKQICWRVFYVELPSDVYSDKIAAICEHLLNLDGLFQILLLYYSNVQNEQFKVIKALSRNLCFSKTNSSKSEMTL